MRKLEEAKKELEWGEKSGQSFTIEELSFRTTLSADTLVKIFGGEVRVDRQSLKDCFRTFNFVAIIK